MRVNSILPAAAAAAMVATTVSAKTITVDVGKEGLTFSPEMITASKGDTLSFVFYPRKHSVVLGTKDKACSPASSGMFYSGFVPSSNGAAAETFEVKVNSTDALYIYCSAAKHCQDGMVAVVNGDKEGLDKYKESAAKASENVSPDAVAGGVIGNGGGGGSSSATGTPTSGGASSTSGSGAASSSTPSSTDKPAAAAGFKASVAGALAAAGGVAAMML